MGAEKSREHVEKASASYEEAEAFHRNDTCEASGAAVCLFLFGTAVLDAGDYIFLAFRSAILFFRAERFATVPACIAIIQFFHFPVAELHTPCCSERLDDLVVVIFDFDVAGDNG